MHSSKSPENLHTAIESYNSKLLAEVVAAKNRKLIENLNNEKAPVLNFIDLKPLLIFALFQKESFNILDFGGGSGSHYHIVRNFLDPNTKLNWAVLETPSMVQEAKNLSTSELSFFDDSNTAVAHLKKIDIGIASGVFEYLDNPIDELKKFLSFGSDAILITRTSLTDNESTLKTIQKSRLKDNGPGPLPIEFEDQEVSYPLKVVNRELFIKTISEKYSIICNIIEDQNVHRIEDFTIHQYGFLCIRK